MTSLRRALFYRIDGVVLLLYVILVAIGITSIFSVEHRSTDVSLFMMNKTYMKQLLFFGYSLLLGFVILLTDSKFFSSFAFLLYTITLGLLVVTIFAGVDVKGSRSWLGVGSFRFQPGEVAKIFTALALAKFISLPETDFRARFRRRKGIKGFLKEYWRFYQDRAIAGFIAFAPAFFILLQKETGLALVYCCFFIALYREGYPVHVYIILFSVIALVLASLLVDETVLLILITVLVLLVAFLMRHSLQRKWAPRIILVVVWLLSMLLVHQATHFVLKLPKHQVERIYSTLGKEVPKSYYKLAAGEESRINGSEYNVFQSKIAIGSGGFWGKGFLNGTSTKNQFVPEQNTDFIFCAIGEQFGFAGSALLVGLYLFLLLRIVYIAERQRSVFTRAYAYCVASIIFFHFAVNISMTIGLMPVIGITLPFLSYGGSSLMAFSILIFILVRLDADRAAIIR